MGVEGGYKGGEGVGILRLVFKFSYSKLLLANNNFTGA